MALPATIRKFEIQLADSDRGVYDTIGWRVAQHPSESERYLIARLIARVLEHADGVDFSKGGVSDDDEPALVHRDLRGDWVAWIEIGSPSPARLHRASKLAPRVAVYGWKQLDELAAAVVDERVYRADALELVALDGATLDSLAATLDRANSWDCVVSGGTLYVTVGGRAFELTPRRVPISSPSR